jgi:hypothetical protein
MFRLFFYHIKEPIVTITLEPRPADSMSHLRGEHAIEGGYYYHGLTRAASRPGPSAAAPSGP